jgi:hypothetical protein
MDILLYFSVYYQGMTDLERKLNKRWGKKHDDKRHWPTYNEQLVKRGEYFLDLEWVSNWDIELEKMNAGKVGSPYVFPNSLIKLQSVWHTHQIPYRMIEGITRQLCEVAQLPDYNNYSTVNRRINQLDVSLVIPIGENIILFCDGSGFQAIEGGEYLRAKYGKKNRRWVQVIVLGDPVTKEPVSIEVNLVPTSEPDSAQRQLDELIEAGVEIEAFGGDGAFDKFDLWDYLEDNEIQPIIKPDKNAREDSDSNWRNKDVKLRNKRGYKAWAKKKKYGTRWPATEGLFSAVKRMFGEHLVAKSEVGMVQEAKLKFVVYKSMKQYGEA